MDDFIEWSGAAQPVAIDSKLRRAQSLVGSSAGRPKDDFYPTPPDATLALLAHEEFPGIIWEPACGDGAISEIVRTLPGTTKVISTDLVDRGYGEPGQDFFKTYHAVDHIITNPPYALAGEFVRHALEQTSGKTAMLLKLSFLEGAKRKSLFENSPLKTVYVFSKRVSMFRNGEKGDYSSGMIAFAWFVWEHGYEGEPTIRWL
ncbi:MAG: hypothetical protein EOP83_25795 [Verrucomicrobiaceae bacterium]|nr:MAG: hypothetical protein EOP83_25795 [Verrucomicrobiaceae bacterium]